MNGSMRPKYMTPTDRTERRRAEELCRTSGASADAGSDHASSHTVSDQVIHAREHPAAASCSGTPRSAYCSDAAMKKNIPVMKLMPKPHETERQQPVHRGKRHPAEPADAAAG